MLKKELKNQFLTILEEELLPAMGCTEPIALAYAAATARTYLNKVPDHMVPYCSGYMIKNVRCASIPNAKGMVGIEVATVLGAFEEMLPEAWRFGSSQSADNLSEGIHRQITDTIDNTLANIPGIICDGAKIIA